MAWNTDGRGSRYARTIDALEKEVGNLRAALQLLLDSASFLETDIDWYEVPRSVIKRAEELLEEPQSASHSG